MFDTMRRGMDGWMDAKAGSSPFHVFEELSLGGLVTLTSPVPYLTVSKCLDPVLIVCHRENAGGQ